jgi:hypothetical protein
MILSGVRLKAIRKLCARKSCIFESLRPAWVLHRITLYNSGAMVCGRHNSAGLAENEGAGKKDGGDHWSGARGADGRL